MEHTPAFKENLARLRACTQHEHIDRVPHFSNFYTWKILDSDLKPKLSEALVDYTILDKMQCEFQERYHFDVHFDLLSRNLLRPATVLGDQHHMVDDEAEAINFYDHTIMNGDEYKEYAENRWSVNWKMYNRKYPELTQGAMALGVIRNFENAAYLTHMKQKFAEVYGCPHAHGPYNVQVPFERFNKYYRGIKEAHIDLRRQKTILKDTFDRIQEDEVMPGLRKALELNTSDCMTDIMPAMLSHSMLNMKQWDEFFWPYFKPQLDLICESGKTVLIYLENSILRFAEYFQDYPKGFLTIVPELDDVVELRKALPNACIVGGMSSDLLGRGTPEQCVDAAKRVIDQMGDGFMLSQNKMMSFRNDCRRENLLAVCEYVQNFRW